MIYDPNKHHRRSIRLQGYDYSTPGAYFVTICVQHRACLFGAMVNGEMRLNDAGQMIQTCWEQLPQRFPTLRLDAYIVMPNHFHAIAVLVGAPTRGAQGAQDAQGAPATRSASRRGAEGPLTIGDIIGAFKSMTTNKYIHGVRRAGWDPFEKRLWQQNYWEYIVRDDDALNRIREYICVNPVRWTSDQLHPKAQPNRFNQD
jgi:REP element-mobilizing transposase RayT